MNESRAYTSLELRIMTVRALLEIVQTPRYLRRLERELMRLSLKAAWVGDKV